MPKFRDPEKRKAMIALGFCGLCGAPRVGEGTTKTFCAICAEKARQWDRNSRTISTHRRNCAACGKEKAVKGFTVCESCRPKVEEQRIKETVILWKKADFCRKCGEPKRDHTTIYCRACLDERRRSA